MEEKKYTENLARYLTVLLVLAIVGTACWYFRNVLFYMVIAAVVALIAHPIFNLLKKCRIKKHRLPDWAASALSIVCVFALLIGVVTLIVPVISSVVSDISKANIDNMTQAISVPLANFNRSLVSSFPGLGRGFKIESVVLEQLQSLFDMSIFSSVIGSVASFVAKLGIAVFAVVFISFFFIKKPGLASSIVIALVPDKYEDKVRNSLGEIGNLVSRYFIGLLLEVLGVSLLNFLGLLLIARMGFKYSIGIACLTGVLNIVPYVGPLIGGALGVSLSLIIKYICASSFGLNVGFLPFVAILIGIFLFTQLVDNYLFQPFIYSNSVKAHPLEIFIVLLIAGQLGGMFGMLVAIPSYTVARVIAKEFFGHVKPIRMLTNS